MIVSAYTRGGKRTLDLVVSALALLILSPLLAVTAVVVRRNLGSPVIFRQQRPGLDGMPFTLLKFRTMRDAVNDKGVALPDADRLTTFGRRLRSTSLDELPELINILRGDMSLVGPRPLLMEYLPRYSPHQSARHLVRPGLTGWAQVNGRNAVDWHERLEMDVWYVNHVSFRLDVHILCMTVAAVFHRRGISADGEATMPPFMGRNDDVG